MGINVCTLSGTAYQPKVCDKKSDGSEMDLVKFDLVQKSRAKGKLISPFMRIPCEVWKMAYAHRLEEKDRVTVQGYLKLAEYEKDGIKKRKHILVVTDLEIHKPAEPTPDVTETLATDEPF